MLIDQTTPDPEEDQEQLEKTQDKCSNNITFLHSMSPFKRVLLIKSASELLLPISRA